MFFTTGSELASTRRATQSSRLSTEITSTSRKFFNKTCNLSHYYLLIESSKGIKQYDVHPNKETFGNFIMIFTVRYVG